MNVKFTLIGKDLDALFSDSIWCSKGDWTKTAHAYRASRAVQFSSLGSWVGHKLKNENLQLWSWAPSLKVTKINCDIGMHEILLSQIYEIAPGTPAPSLILVSKHRFFRYLSLMIRFQIPTRFKECHKLFIDKTQLDFPISMIPQPPSSLLEVISSSQTSLIL